MSRTAHHPPAVPWWTGTDDSDHRRRGNARPRPALVVSYRYSAATLRAAKEEGRRPVPAKQLLRARSRAWIPFDRYYGGRSVGHHAAEMQAGARARVRDLLTLVRKLANAGADHDQVDVPVEQTRSQALWRAS
ncbi:hypothetical protein ACWCP6_10200 [Streptomyces sp. NPDC002004]